eukprot:gnl/TRDRNA2_/TRDRNA2_150624_c0_seq1.p1 gnl/TRDRNA2_/TRDRNA2_150624_c0~~gnl/TRDRNA2_/TRDRNA2_150624_c0_seq1.p1  ORF type:complete len:276 (+),score=45.62 gnl/TRDRNA2_/TRDRNA2_150624_c0_seq1:19-846(+)
MTLHLALFGFGNANKTLARLLLEKHDALASGGLQVSVVAIFTKSHDNAWVAEKEDGPAKKVAKTNALGLPLNPALDAACDGRLSVLAGREVNLGSSTGHVVTQPSPGFELQHVLSILGELRSRGRLDAVAEAVPADYETAEPALSLARWCLAKGVHFVTANKAPVALALDELQALASSAIVDASAAVLRRPRFLFESACMDGVPIFNLARHCLPAVQIMGFEGILNSTTNMILSDMEQDADLAFEDALLRAQAVGIAETVLMAAISEPASSRGRR